MAKPSRITARAWPARQIETGNVVEESGPSGSGGAASTSGLAIAGTPVQPMVTPAATVLVALARGGVLAPEPSVVASSSFGSHVPAATEDLGNYPAQPLLSSSVRIAMSAADTNASKVPYSRVARRSYLAATLVAEDLRATNMAFNDSTAPDGGKQQKKLATAGPAFIAQVRQKLEAVQTASETADSEERSKAENAVEKARRAGAAKAAPRKP